jgi:hypothetical protein
MFKQLHSLVGQAFRLPELFQEPAKRAKGTRTAGGGELPADWRLELSL